MQQDDKGAPQAPPVPPSGTAPQQAAAELAGAAAQSAAVRQLRALVHTRGVTYAALARALGKPEGMVRAWLEGEAPVSVPVLEAILRTLRMVPVFVPADRDRVHGSNLADYLDPIEAAIFAVLSDKPADVLRTSLRDLQLQRLRLEKDWQAGIVDDDTYREWILRFNDSARFITDAITRTEVAANMVPRDEFGRPLRTLEGDPIVRQLPDTELDRLIGRLLQRKNAAAVVAAPVALLPARTRRRAGKDE